MKSFGRKNILYAVDGKQEENTDLADTYEASTTAFF